MQDPKSNVISVVSVVPDGNAARSGVLVGDQLVSTSGVVVRCVAVTATGGVLGAQF